MKGCDNVTELYNRYPNLKQCKTAIDSALNAICDTYQSGGKLLACGNGGSCADCEHIVGELMKGFLLYRSQCGLEEKFSDLNFDDAEYMAKHLQGALPAISLPHQTALTSAFANDVAADMIYAQLVYGYAKKDDILVCISTSGNSKNMVYAAKTAKMLGVKTLALTGENESALSDICDVTIRVPETETYKVQELHLPVYHYLCAEVEAKFFK